VSVSKERLWPTFAEPPLRGRVAVVTGGAKGLGSAISEILACDGADVVVSGRDQEALERQVATIADSYASVGTASIPCDVTEESQVEALISETVRRFGQLDILVNAAGVTGPIETPAHEVPLQNFRAVLDTNILGTFLPCRAAIPHMIKRGEGRIVNISGTSGLRGYRNRVAYSSSKWAVRGLTRTLALELGVHGITVNAICPNVMNGDRMSTIVKEKAKRVGRSEEDVYDDFASQTALGRFIEAVDVANAVRYLVGDGGCNVTGHDIVVDAGWDV
jgi:NAD(P)-dependent dehydrogenase (short-subunit alcohol dehydrogenase family)